MSRRTLLSAEQRARLFGVPTESAEMARHYVFSPDDLLLVRAKRRSMNRLGFAVQPGLTHEIAPVESPDPKNAFRLLEGLRR
jgi:hypothetical protein